MSFDQIVDALIIAAHVRRNGESVGFMLVKQGSEKPRHHARIYVYLRKNAGLLLVSGQWASHFSNDKAVVPLKSCIIVCWLSDSC